jgi:glycosyltransferase involved in cell wall biosynthesis
VTVPDEVQRLAAQRQQARAAKDYASSDALRDQIAELGWTVKDTPAGQQLAVAPPYQVLVSVGDLPDRSGEPAQGRCTVALLVDGWPDDLRTCVTALLEHTPDDVEVVLLENGETDAGTVVHELAGHPRVTELHVERPAGWAEARNALIRWDTASVHVLMDLSTVVEGDAVTPLLEALEGADAAGWRGVHVEDGWLSFADSPAGEVEALLSYLIAVRREAALEVPLPAKARFYRNADMEWSFLLREQGKRLVSLDLPVRQDRHRGYHDSDPVMRDRESKKTYDRFLQRFRGREELRLGR